MSPLRRHVGRLLEDVKFQRIVNAEGMALVTSSLPHLSRLDITLAKDAAPFHFPPSIRCLSLGLSEFTSPPALQAAISAVVRLQHLEALTLRFGWGQQAVRDVSFAPLAGVANLTTLGFHWLEATEQQMQQLRSLHQLRTLDCHQGTISLSALLALPHQLQLTKLAGITIATEEDSAAVANLPALTCLRAVDVRVLHADFLQQQHLPALQSLGLGFVVVSADAPAVDIPRAIAAL